MALLVLKSLLRCQTPALGLLAWMSMRLHRSSPLREQRACLFEPEPAPERGLRKVQRPWQGWLGPAMQVLAYLQQEEDSLPDASHLIALPKQRASTRVLLAQQNAMARP